MALVSCSIAVFVKIDVCYCEANGNSEICQVGCC